MDGEEALLIGCSPRERKRSYKDFLMDVEDLEEPGSEVKERPHQGPSSPNKRQRQHSGELTGPEMFGVDSADFLPVYPVCVSRGRWGERDEEENIQDNLLHSGCSPPEGSVDQASPGSMLEHWDCLEDQHNLTDCPFPAPVTPPATPAALSPLSVTASSATAASAVSPVTCRANSTTTSSYNSPTVWARDTLESTPGGPGCSDLEPVDAAAHLHLLGESLSLIGHQLQETNKMVCVSSSLSLLLDSLLCALAPLISLTSQIPELRSCTQTLAVTMENIVYVMPGL
ncbi:uncharacterized protein hmgxb4b isoform X2 [Genypterus blacodes]|uniref:uncharacterized protein hmgxb4b isoform X2 n=1 Tax=Genypterus blacodes TaxID=154954 RepID=UPI003F768555